MKNNIRFLSCRCLCLVIKLLISGKFYANYYTYFSTILNNGITINSVNSFHIVKMCLRTVSQNSILGQIKYNSDITAFIIFTFPFIFYAMLKVFCEDYKITNYRRSLLNHMKKICTVMGRFLSFSF